ncbi:hypothetical protein J7T55_013669 [Diaporthe amygdali]|uniref:uncharacterized protein n=1 Tax=Phomopsis amygdali TaxID=1214568 RepID=UPI0022FE5E31|nr:uncharacterized protein J7T55_013669 [Diaporthe amygdali]KAJ0119467.1 hypothetical protein J7T55_013669 [Diaporthe amygdali]
MPKVKRGGPGGRGGGGQGVAGRPQGEVLPTRPGVASNPTPVSLYANCFDLVVKKGKLNVYLNTFKVLGHKNQEIRGATAKRIFKLALESLQTQPNEYATDFQQQIVTLSRLEVPLNSNKERRLEIEKCAVNFEGPEVELRLDDSVLNSPSPNAINCLNLIMGHWAREQTNVAAIGRHRFFPQSNNWFSRPPKGSKPQLNLGDRFNTDTPESLSVSRGFFQSVRPANAKLLLNVNTTFGVFRPEGNIKNLYDALEKKYDFTKNSVTKIEVLTRLHEAIAKALVIYENPKDNKLQTVRIAGFGRKTDSGNDKGNPSNEKDHPLLIKEDFPRPGYVSFWFKKGTKEGYRTVKDHFRETYGVPLNPHLPLVNMGKPTRPQYIPAEKCRLVWGQKLTRKVTEIPGLTQEKLNDLNLFTCRRPYDNLTWIKSVHQHLSLVPGVNKALTNFGVSVGKNLVKVDGRTLASPTIKYSVERSAQVNNASWSLTNVNFIKTATVQRWTWVFMSRDKRDTPSSVSRFIGELRNILRDKCGQGDEYDVAEDHCINADEGIAGLNRILSSAKAKGISLVVLICQNKMSVTTYNAVKFIGDILHGIHTSCILEESCRKLNEGTNKEAFDWNYFANVAMKINLKLGGINHKLEQTVELFRKPGLMVAGYDVTHPTGEDSIGEENEAKESATMDDGVKGPDEGVKQTQDPKNDSEDPKKEQSQVGVVVSTDTDLGRWFPYYWNQPPRQEMTNTTLVDAFVSGFEAWKSANVNKKVLKAVIYRDGVSESQFQQVLEQEVPQIRTAHARVFPDAKLDITLLVAIKRHATRFFVGNDESAPNIKPGTVVDNGVTQPKYWEFFLASHAAVKGTTKPTRYVVLVDEIFRKGFSQIGPANELERFTNQMSHLFGRATKAVSVCTPAYYADILCTRARAYKAALDDANTRFVVEKSIANEKEDVRARVLAGEIHPDMKNSMYWI